MTALAEEQGVRHIETTVTINVTAEVVDAVLEDDDGEERPPRLLDELELEGLVAAAFGQGGQIPFDGDFLVNLNLDPTDYVITVDIGIW